MKVETIEGITLSIPEETNLAKNSFDIYEDDQLEVQLAIFNDYYLVNAANQGYQLEEDFKMIDIDDIPSGAVAYESDAKWLNIFVPNEFLSKGIVVGASDQSLAIEMAKSVNFNN